ncbi:MAG: dihydropyrimidinase [Anaerolineaceae bacterium]|nr:dihydropyrimidinase [Anaerolineaceae bacterium]
MPFDLVIHDGLLVTLSDTFQADLGITGGKIAAIGQKLHGEKTINARGLYVLPGAVDPHTHLEMPVGKTKSSDDWFTGTRAAAHGGTTTVIDFVETAPHQSLVDALAARRSLAENRAAIDFAFHMTLSNASRSTLDEIPAMIETGVTSFKVYTTYAGLRLTDSEFLKVLQAVSAHKGLVIVHSENDSIVKYFTQKLLDSGKLAPQYHPLSRPDIAEGEAVARILSLAEAVCAPVYIVHISSAKGAKAVAAAQLRGQNVLGETCTQYLLLTEAEYQRPGFEAAKFVCQPPLRKAEDCAALWAALGTGSIRTIGTDHCPFNFVGQKDMGSERFTEIPGGLPGIESRLALVYSYGVRKGLISLNQWVSLCCTNPAVIFGLYPRKGSLLPGADADIVLFDPKIKKTLSHTMLHENVDYTPYEGFQLQGYPVKTLLRGEVLIDGEKAINVAGKGKYLKCGLPRIRSTP